MANRLSGRHALSRLCGPFSVRSTPSPSARPAWMSRTSTRSLPANRPSAPWRGRRSVGACGRFRGAARGVLEEAVGGRIRRFPARTAAGRAGRVEGMGSAGGEHVAPRAGLDRVGPGGREAVGYPGKDLAAGQQLGFRAHAFAPRRTASPPNPPRRGEAKGPTSGTGISTPERDSRRRGGLDRLSESRSNAPTATVVTCGHRPTTVALTEIVCPVLACRRHFHTRKAMVVQLSRTCRTSAFPV